MFFLFATHGRWHITHDMQHTGRAPQVIYTKFYKCSGRVRGRVVARLETGCGWICVSWWYGRSRSRGGSASGRLGLPSWRLSWTVCFYDWQSVSVTGCLCLWQTVFDRHSLCLSQTVCVCNIQLFLLQTVCVCHRQTMSLTVSLCLSETVCGCHRQSVSVTHSLCLSQTVYVCQRQYLSVTGSLCLTQTLFLIILGLVFAYLSVIFTKICPWDLNWIGQGLKIFPLIAPELNQFKL